MTTRRLQVVLCCCLFAGLAKRAAAQTGTVNEIGFEATLFTVQESAGFVAVGARLTDFVGFNQNQNPPPTLQVQIMGSASTSDGSASSVLGSDYTAVINSLVTFTPGSAINSRQNIMNILITNDNIVEPIETFFMTLIPVPGPGNPQIDPQLSVATIIIIDDDLNLVTIGLVPPPGLNVPSYEVPENSGLIEICVEVTGGSVILGQTVTVTFSTSDSSAQQPADYGQTVVNFQFNAANTNSMLCVNVPIQNDLLCEGNEIFIVSLATTDSNVILNPTRRSGTVTIIDDDTALIALNFVEQRDPAGSVTECMDEQLCFNLAFATGVTKAPGRQCVVSVQTEDGSATVANGDYTELTGNCVFTTSTVSCQFCITIQDDSVAELDEYFSILLNTNNPSACQIQNNNVTATIVDDEDCRIDDNPCGDLEECQELPCPNNFTCIPEGVGDDPHFAVTMANGKTLCYTVQGEHGFAFNLISNKKVYMNAMFVPDAHREEVTWLGTMGIVINNNGYKNSNMTRLRFEAIKNKIHIDKQMILEARNIEKITFANGKMTVSEAPPTEGYKQPFVRVDLKDVELSFSIKFMTEHLDLYWHSTGQKVADSHGLIGQFFRDGVSLDNIRKLLILPGKEPVPIQRKPLWSFMERESGDSTNFCWVAMNPGYQGEGLIDGSYFDYLVDDVLSTEFKYKKL